MEYGFYAPVSLSLLLFNHYHGPGNLFSIILVMIVCLQYYSRIGMFSILLVMIVSIALYQDKSGQYNTSYDCVYSTMIRKGVFSIILVIIVPIVLQQDRSVQYNKSTDSGGYVKFTPKYIIVGGKGGVSELFLRGQSSSFGN